MLIRITPTFLSHLFGRLTLWRSRRVPLVLADTAANYPYVEHRSGSGETDELAIFLQKLSNIRLSDEIGRYKRMWLNAQVLADGFLEIERKIERFYDPADHEVASLDKIKELVDGYRKAANDQANSQSPEKANR